jgi:hypothetical protein
MRGVTSRDGLVKHSPYRIHDYLDLGTSGNRAVARNNDSGL